MARLELEENEEIVKKLEEPYRRLSASLDKIMNENQRQWGSPEAMLITVAIFDMSQKLDKLISLLEPKEKQCCKKETVKPALEDSLKSLIDGIFVKPRMRAKDISPKLPEGMTIKMLMEKGLIKKDNPFVYSKV